MYTTEQFEKALLEQKVLIIRMVSPNGIVKQATGYVEKIFLQWNAEGKCTYCKVPVPTYNLNF
jgi:hypothetical protein